MKAMILAAGRGTRLRPITDSTPKCMVRIAGKPILQHTIERLCRYGVREVMINVSHLPGPVMNHFGDGHKWGMTIRYSVEQEPLGTAGGVKNVEWFFDGSAFVWYGDNLTTCKLDRLVAFHRSKGGAVSVALYYREDPTSSGIASVDEDDRIVRFQEKPRPDQAFSHWINAGILIIEPSVLELIPAEGAPDFGKDVFPTLLARGQPLFGYRMSTDEEVWWIDTPEDLERVRNTVTAEKLQIASGGGAQCDVASDAWPR